MSYPWYDIPDRDDFPEDAEPIGTCTKCGETIREGDDYVKIGDHDLYCAEHIFSDFVPLYQCAFCGCEIKSDEVYYQAENGDELYCGECVFADVRDRAQFERRRKINAKRR